MIALSSGYQFDYMIPSGGLAYDGLGWRWERPLVRVGIIDPSLFTVVIKTLSYRPIIGNQRWYNPFRAVRPLFDNQLLLNGVANAVSLSNPGYLRWREEVAPNVDFSWQRLVASVSPEGSTCEEFAEMVSDLGQLGFVAVEINTSCPNVAPQRADEVIRCVGIAREATKKPLILKVSAAQDVSRIIPAVEGKIDAVSINAVPWDLVFPERRSPLAHLGGGAVSGKLAQQRNWNLLRWIKTISDLPVIGPDVWDFSDIARLGELGADAWSFGALQLCFPWKPTMYVKKAQSITRGNSLRLL